MHPSFSPSASLLLPGLWHWFNGYFERGLLWGLAIVITAPLVLPAIVLWFLCWRDADRLARILPKFRG
jgi:hypothetical protein